MQPLVEFKYNHDSTNATASRCFLPRKLSTMWMLNKEVQTMEESLGQRIARLRRSKGLTQEELGDKVGISSQAVSKWETDSSVPDVTLLVKIANIFDISVDELLGNERIRETPKVVPAENRKDVDKMILKITVDSNDGDKVRINLPITIVKLMTDNGAKMPEVNGNDALKDIDWTQVFALIEQGVIGKLVEIESADGDKINIVVE
ncbi:MAG: XRE family transcriptional regulator [Bacteroidia bacterium]|nr:XRE family transcriptional regulator [Bacteroidia bacterium]